MQHIPVLLKEVIELLNPKDGQVVLDVTIGLGGHAKAFLVRIGSRGKLIGLDADQNNLSLANEALAEFGSAVELHLTNFSQINELNIPKVDIVFADLGLSSPHIDDPNRGFTFREDASLDMRYDQSSGITASELISSLKEDALANVLWKYGELRTSRRIAKIIKESDKVDTTFKLKECIEKSAGYKAKHIIPQVFQALRIAVNDELGSLEILLSQVPDLIKPGGRIGIISYHSLEDRMVKQAFRKLSEPEIDPVTGQIVKAAPFEIVTKKPIVPSESEIEANPRARSAKLRIISRLAD
ncbi:MAG: 16S rRNA (cytosine(1402)-N(4))-methyltransferase RsmH [Candidatus Peribacteraceae bacterium]|jgi:16S rRNA (cytosine1402-N4)-methyltransferase|nr:16S rRNA (cytosine(1402)-N(4))-methyltransferase RsmH [Candidatus Peribacteraceae bacterium]HCI03778.1 16S rRNA (cytosine(1402)-N(4))-methyltransferase [Candidatus Peribacteria bacterium]|tara:strand:+ start:14587 stop:15480 length:894 start_codon:yes stop_codon:yes gene_type:complete